MSSELQLTARLERPGFVLDVDLLLPARGVSVLFGPSGSGKTSCLRVLAGLEPHAKGVVRVDGEVWQDSAQRVMRPVHQRALGYVFQEASLFDHLNVRDNLMFGFQRTPPTQRRHAWDHGLELLGIAHLLERSPLDLSGGERQRVAIARALATSPRVLLMDEPLAALDATRKGDILPWLEQLHEALDIPVLYVTHSLDEALRLGDQLVLLQAGRVQAQGPVAELLARSDLPLAHGDGASALVAAEVEASNEPGMDRLRFEGGALWLPRTRQELSALGRRVRVRVQARDVTLSLVPPEQSSVVNVLPATVTDLSPDGLAQVLVGLQVGEAPGTRLLSRITQASATRLGIRPGLAVWAQIKGVAMVR